MRMTGFHWAFHRETFSLDWGADGNECRFYNRTPVCQAFLG
jgi:hypothetical protein